MGIPFYQGQILQVDTPIIGKVAVQEPVLVARVVQLQEPVVRSIICAQKTMLLAVGLVVDL